MRGSESRRRTGQTVEVAGVRRYEFPIVDDDPRGVCQTCGAEIVWIETVSGRRMPLSRRTVRVDDGGQAWAESHFSDCPEAGLHRRPGRR